MMEPTTTVNAPRLNHPPRLLRRVDVALGNHSGVPDTRNDVSEYLEIICGDLVARALRRIADHRAADKVKPELISVNGFCHRGAVRHQQQPRVCLPDLCIKLIQRLSARAEPVCRIQRDNLRLHLHQAHQSLSWSA